MKYFLDAEFNDVIGKGLELISIGIVNEKGKGFYAECTSFKKENCNDFVMQNVLPKLKYTTYDMKDSIIRFGDQKHDAVVSDSLLKIGQAIKEYVGNDQQVEFWGYYSAYDWVLFCWLFGGLCNLPDNFPQYCIELQQCLDYYGKTIPSALLDRNNHNALEDAEFHKNIHDWLFQEIKS